MRALALLVLLAGVVLPLRAPAIDSEPPMADPALETRYRALTSELRCLVCQNQTIGDSEATLAQDLRREVRGMLLAGRSDDEIRSFMTARYGDFVLYKPPVTARTILLWAAPALLVLAGLGTVGVVIVRRSRRPFGLDETADRNGDGGAQA
jgi:cytochrome c-type biogenesis protein CcmH